MLFDSRRVLLVLQLQRGMLRISNSSYVDLFAHS